MGDVEPITLILEAQKHIREELVRLAKKVDGNGTQSYQTQIAVLRSELNDLRRDFERFADSQVEGKRSFWQGLGPTLIVAFLSLLSIAISLLR